MWRYETLVAIACQYATNVSCKHIARLHSRRKDPAMLQEITPIAVRPSTLSGISEQMVVSHYENNYGNAVRTLNAVRRELAALDAKKVRSPPEAMDLRGTRFKSQIPTLFPQRFPVNSRALPSVEGLWDKMRFDAAIQTTSTSKVRRVDFGGCGRTATLPRIAVWF